MGVDDDVHPGAGVIRRFRALYGAGPLHLLVLLACFAVAAVGVVGWYKDSQAFKQVLEWFIAAILLHDLAFVPLYSLLDRIVFSRAGDGAAEGGEGAHDSAPPGRRRRKTFLPTSAIPYLRVPAILSGLLLIVFFPLILRRGSLYLAATGLTPNVYLGRWLATTGVLFAISALAYAIAMWRARRRSGARTASGGSASRPRDPTS